MDKPGYWLIAGANGVGKSTVIETHFQKPEIAIIMPDKIHKEMRFKDPFSLGEEINSRFQLAADNRRDIVFEHNLHNSTPFLRMENLKKRGYDTNLLFLLSPSDAFSARRVDDRVSKGGHYIDMETIKDRRSKGISNLKTNLAVPNHIFIADASRNRDNRDCVLKFYKGILVALQDNIPKWIEKEFRIQIELNQKLGKTTQIMNELKF